MGWGRRGLACGVLLVAAAGCGSSPDVEPQAPAPVAVPVKRGPQRDFRFAGVDGRPVTGTSLRGRMTIIAFATTYDAASQAQARFVQELLRAHAPRINALLLVLEPAHHEPLVKAFATTLGLSYPVAMADAATIAGEGPFAGLHHVPAVVILDRKGHEVWRRVGLVERDELDETLRRLE
jgi:hypothetical protein